MEPRAYSYIRFSTPEQEKGDSLRRQSNPIEEIAAKLNLPLDNTLKLTDRGLSAYKGDNLTKGAMGEFLKLVDKNKIAVGSCLIIENFDRLTRLNMPEAINLLTGLLLKGIDIYTVMDEKHFSKDTYEITDLITSAVILQQGNLESEKKSLRLKEAWENKRKTISDTLFTSKAPSWLKAVGQNEGKRFIEIPEAVQVIREIFRMRLNGMGRDKIVRELNKRDVWRPPGRRRKNADKQLIPSWRTSYIDKILRNNRAVLGEFQPHKFIVEADGKRKRVPDGPVQLKHFPAIIDEETYNRVQSTFETYDGTRKHQGGRNGMVNNLFGNLAYCSECNFPIQYVNKGYTSKGGQYIVCDKQRREVDGGCTNAKIKYSKFEENILLFCAGLDVSEIITDSKDRLSELSNLQKHLQAIDGELKILSPQLDDIALEIVKTSNETLKITHRHNASRLAIRLDKLKQDKKDTEIKISELSFSSKNTEQQLNDVQELISRMKVLEGQDRIDLRLSLRNQMRRLIKKIIVNLDKKTVTIFFQSGQVRAINLITGRVTNAYPKRAGFIKTDKGFIKKP